MVRKVQLPVIGGVRKVVTVPGSNVAVGTTIAEFGSNTVTLAQLAAALDLLVPPNTGTIGGDTPVASIALGPGLSGGGPLLGSVPIRLVAPIPVFIMGDEGGGDSEPGPPGQQGQQGIAGAPGVSNIPGPAVFMLANDGEDGHDAVPGSPGAAGPQGNPGTAGAIGPAVFMVVEDGIDGDPGPPGVPGLSNNASSNPFNVTPDTHGTGVPAFVANDEFEEVALDTGGTRFTGALPWTLHNTSGTAAANLNSGSLVGVTDGVASSLHSITQTAGNSTWRYRAKFSAGYAGTPVSGGFVVRESSTSKSLNIGLLINTGASPNIWLAYFTNDTTFNNFVGLTGYTFTYDTFLNWFVSDLWHEIELLGGTVTYRISRSGIDGSFIQVGSIGIATAGITAVDGVGLGWFGGVSAETIFQCDWFRRQA